MSKILTPEEWGKEQHDTIKVSYGSFTTIDDIIMNYAKYYTQVLIESMTDEELENESKRIGGRWIRRINGANDMAKWLREELLKKNKNFEG